ncbi:TetR family transcriptional regulator [Ferrimonas balearica]|nr:TetR family transcriptional regulator [Ferrimonas balearica]
MTKKTPVPQETPASTGAGANERTAVRADGKATRDKILDAAETAFATGPYDAVSLRRITGEAGVNLALVKYYFSSKENLFAAAIARRAPDLARLRMQRLAELRAAGTLDSETLVATYMRPLFDKMKSQDPGWVSYVRMIAYTVQDGRFEALISEHFDEVALAYVEAIRASLPDAREEDVLCGLTFLLALTMRCLSGEMGPATVALGRVDFSDLDAIYERLMPFCSAGLMRMSELR